VTDAGGEDRATAVTTLAALLRRIRRGAAPPPGPAFVAAALVALVSGAVWFVLRFGSDMPTLDEWGLAGRLTGHQPLTAEWLWSQHNEHRILLPRLFYVACARLTGGNLRVGLVLDVLALGALSAALIAAVRRDRGRVEPTDVVFPLALLHLGHWSSLLGGIQMAFVFSTLLLGVVLAQLVAWDGRRTGAATTIGVCAVALPLCGGQGALMAVPLAAWLAGAGLVAWRSGAADARRTGAAAMGLAAAAIALVAFYGVGYRTPPHLQERAGTLEAARTTLQYLAGGLGPAGWVGWPTSGAAVVAIAVAVARSLVGAWRQGGDRGRILGLVAAMVCAVLPGAAIGWARPGPDAGFAERYTLPAAAFFVCAYATLQVCGRIRGTGAPVGRTFVLAIVCAGLFHNIDAGLANGGRILGRIEALELDLWTGTSLAAAAERYPDLVRPGGADLEKLRFMRQAGMGPFGVAPAERRPRVRAYYRRTFPMLRTPPDSMWSRDFAVHLDRCGGGLCALVHTPGAVSYHLEAGAYRLVGRYGLCEESYREAGRTDGVRLRVLATDAAGRATPLLDRALDPWRVAADRGPQRLDVEVRADGPVDLELRNDPGPTPNWDQFYYSALEVKPAARRGYPRGR
jgi:hypothetical protein